MKETDFTLVPYGGLGNRIFAICSAIVFCKQYRKSLCIIWFKDQGLNCSYQDLFLLSEKLDDVTIREASFCDYILRDRPRKKNLWIPHLFQFFMYDRRIYKKELSDILYKKKVGLGPLEKYKHVFMASYSKLWANDEMWSYVVPNHDIKNRVEKITSGFGENTIGLHIRRSDNMTAINQSATFLCVNKIEEEISKNPDTRFFLTSDSLAEREKLVELFGDKIITCMKETKRNTKDGIIEAYTEILVLSHTRKIYGSAFSSFSELGHLISGNEFEILKIE